MGSISPSPQLVFLDWNNLRAPCASRILPPKQTCLSTATNITWSHDGKYLFFTTSTVHVGSTTSTIQTSTKQVWDASTNKKLTIDTSIFTSTSTSPGSPYANITWSTDDKHLAFVKNSIDQSCEITTNSSSCNGTVYIWDATTICNPYVLPLSLSVVVNIAWSPDNSRSASVSGDGTLYVWYAV